MRLHCLHREPVNRASPCVIVSFLLKINSPVGPACPHTPCAPPAITLCVHHFMWTLCAPPAHALHNQGIIWSGLHHVGTTIHSNYTLNTGHGKFKTQEPDWIQYLGINANFFPVISYHILNKIICWLEVIFIWDSHTMFSLKLLGRSTVTQFSWTIHLGTHCDIRTHSVTMGQSTKTKWEHLHLYEVTRNVREMSPELTLSLGAQL